VAPPSIKGLLHRGLAIGADEARLLWDSSFGNLDSHATGVVLAEAIGSLQYDLILCEQKAIDIEAGQVGSVIAERLDIPLASRVVNIDVTLGDKKVTVESKLEKVNRARVDVNLPALLMVEVDLNEPRYPSLPSLVAGLRKDIKEYDLKAIGLSYEEVAAEGVKTRTVTLSPPRPRPKKVFTRDSHLAAEERLRLIISGGVTQKQGDLLEGDPGTIASSVVRFLGDKKFLLM
jgi:electron transfer flavoprotein beta subunit